MQEHTHSICTSRPPTPPIVYRSNNYENCCRTLLSERSQQLLQYLFCRPFYCSFCRPFCCLLGYGGYHSSALFFAAFLCLLSIGAFLLCGYYLFSSGFCSSASLRDRTTVVGVDGVLNIELGYDFR